jgi:rSAM/selenodomain-associated transferase 1
VVHKHIFGLTVKCPDPGLVKTRLARDIGDHAACEIYRTMAEKIFAETSPDAGSYERMVFYSPSASEQKVTEWLPGVKVLPQRGADIGEIMDNAFCDMFGAGAGKAVVTGVDIPGLNSHIVNLAFQELGHADVVIGPAMDGGYYLIGMKARLSDIFRGIPWGTAKVLVETLRVAGRLKLTVRTVTAMTDVDTLDDLLKVKDLHPAYFKGT